MTGYSSSLVCLEAEAAAEEAAAAGGAAVPQAWLDQLAIGGRLVAPVVTGAPSAGKQSLLVIDKTEHGLRQTVLEGVHFVPLKSGLA